jgi:hypothetical protein
MSICKAFAYLNVELVKIDTPLLKEALKSAKKGGKSLSMWRLYRETAWRLNRQRIDNEEVK